MRRRRIVAVLAGMMLAAGCSGAGSVAGDETTPPADEAPTNEASTPSASEPPAEELTAAQAQSVVDSVVLPEATVGLVATEAPNSGSGLGSPTFTYCDAAHEVPTGEDLRVARTQRWWSDDAYRAGTAGGVSVGDEVVYYSGDGAQQVMTALAGVPDACPEAVQLDDGSYLFTAAPQPSAVPDGAVTLRMELTRADGSQLQGFVIAQAAANIVDIVYVYSDDEAVLDQWATRLAPEAQALLAAAPSV